MATKMAAKMTDKFAVNAVLEYSCIYLFHFAIEHLGMALYNDFFHV